MQVVHPARKSRGYVLDQRGGGPEVFVDRGPGLKERAGDFFLQLAGCHQMRFRTPCDEPGRKVGEEGLSTADDRA